MLERMSSRHLTEWQVLFEIRAEESEAAREGLDLNALADAHDDEDDEDDEDEWNG